MTEGTVVVWTNGVLDVLDDGEWRVTPAMEGAAIAGDITTEFSKAVATLVRERDEAKSAWERLHVEHANLRLDRDDEVSRLKQWASAGLSAFHGRLCIGVGGAGVTDDARTCHDPKCVAWAKALEGHSPKKTAREQHLEDLADAFAMEVERAAAQRTRPAGCMQVPAHGDFVNATPSVLSRLSWWARAFREALKS